MPRIPQYTQRETLSPQQTVVAGTGGGDVEKYKAVSKITANIADAAIKFNRLRYQNQSDEAEIEASQKIEEFRGKVSMNPGKYTPGDVKSELAKIGTESSAKITNQEYRNEYLKKYNLGAIKVGAAINAKVNSYNIKQLDFQTREKLKRYVSDINRLEKANEDLRLKVESGFYTNEQAKKIKDDTISSWILVDGEKDPAGTIDAINKGEYGEIKPENKAKVVNDLKALAEVRQEEFRVAEEQRYSENQAELYDSISTESNYVENLNRIQEKENNGAIDKKTAESAKKYIKSKNRVKARTHNESFTSVLGMIGDLQTTFNKDADKGDAADYLRKERDARNHIINLRAAGKLTESDERKLLDKINKKQYSERRKSAELLSESGSTWTWGYDNAMKMFKDNLTNQALGNEAMRKYFYKIEEMKKPNKKQKQAAAREIINDLNNSAISEAVNITREGDVATIGGKKVKIVK